MQYNGFFITFEGVEGAGKTHQAKLLSEKIDDVILTREPGGTEVSEDIRNLFLEHDNITAKTELLLIEAARSQHVEQVILPALKKNKTVICDRFTDATIAYQGYRKGIDLQLIENLNQIASLNLIPNLTILLDLPVDIGLKRKNNSIDEVTRIEKEDIKNHQKVRQGYLELAEQNKDRIFVIDATLEPHIVHNIILRIFIATKKTIK